MKLLLCLTVSCLVSVALAAVAIPLPKEVPGELHVPESPEEVMISIEHQVVISNLTQKDPQLAFNPNPRNYDHLNNEIFLSDLNEGKLDDQLAVNFETFFRSSAEYKGDFGLKTVPNFLKSNPSVSSFNIKRDGCPSGFEEELLGHINRLRARHQASPVSFSRSLIKKSLTAARESQNYATSDNATQLVYRIETRNGNFSADLSPKTLAQHLYSPGLNAYRLYGSEPVDPPPAISRAFTAMVWKSTSQVGIACAVSHQYSRYDRGHSGSIQNVVNVAVNFGGNRGNVEGQFAKNVLPPNDIEWHDYTLILTNDVVNMHFGDDDKVTETREDSGVPHIQLVQN